MKNNYSKLFENSSDVGNNMGSETFEMNLIKTPLQDFDKNILTSDPPKLPRKQVSVSCDPYLKTITSATFFFLIIFCKRFHNARQSSSFCKNKKSEKLTNLIIFQKIFSFIGSWNFKIFLVYAFSNSLFNLIMT